MEFEKCFDGTIDVANPIDFCADKRHLIAAVRDKYAGRCFKGAYILGIKSILDKSACHIVRTNGSGEGYIDVRFLADVAVFSRWDILTGVEIVSHQQMLVGVYEGAPNYGNLDAEQPPAEQPPAEQPPGGQPPGGQAPKARSVVAVLASKAVESIAVGQKIAVRVLHASHTPMHSQASVVGALLVCDQSARAYRLRGALDQSARAELAPMFAAVESELKARAALIKTRKADLWFFELLLYAFRDSGAGAPNAPGKDSEFLAWEGGPVWSGPHALQPLEAGVKAVSALDIVRRVVVDGESVPVTGVWSRSLALHRSSPLVAVARGEGVAAPSAWVVVDGTPRAVFAEILKNILDFLVATRELILVYSSRDLINSHINLWSVMRSAQRLAVR